MTSAEVGLRGLRDGYRREVLRRALILGLAGVALLVLVALDLSLGPSGMTLREVGRALAAGPNGEDRMAATILWRLRMPQTAMGVAVGCCLGLAGLQMQTILDNSLASPFTLGFSAAAGFGAALAIMFGALFPIPGVIVVPVLAFTMTLLACVLVHLVARTRGATSEVLVLAGIAILFFFQSLQSLLQYLASPEVLQQIVFWLFGSLLKANWPAVAVTTGIFLVCLPLVTRDVWSLTALRLGEANAASLGLRVAALRYRAFTLVALLTAGAVSFVGTIGFVGLIAPHLARSLAGEDHRFSLPLAAVMGAVCLIGASVFGKLMSPGAVIPVGIITAVAGIPMLLVVILRKGSAAP
ncbi:MAG: iron ABC transporter permease [Rhodospirillum sp.]|nr:iron ABC transporter permease [Rhodospirillum sp.]MCF8491169.1 iron ABC transporter permease [Rhodospirillum sp.]MCF8502499.1 iron ABC transporter permease [Rhodospirillum sp.]